MSSLLSPTLKKVRHCGRLHSASPERLLLAVQTCARTSRPASFAIAPHIRAAFDYRAIIKGMLCVSDRAGDVANSGGRQLLACANVAVTAYIAPAPILGHVMVPFKST